MSVVSSSNSSVSGLWILVRKLKARVRALGCLRVLPWVRVLESGLEQDRQERAEALQALDELQVNYNPTARSDALYGKIRAVLRVEVVLVAMFVCLTGVSLIPEYGDEFAQAKRGVKVCRVYKARGKEWMV